VLSLIACAATSVYGDVAISSGIYGSSSYYSLKRELSEAAIASNLCFAHSKSGIDSLVKDSEHCTDGIVMYGAAPNRFQMSLFKSPVLVIGGTRDGVTPMSEFAVSRYHNRKATYILIPGASHTSVMDAPASHPLDLQAVLSPEEVRAHVTQLVTDFLGLTNSGALKAAVVRTAELADPVVAALELEGSAELGDPWCQSDFPTNPTCQYPIYPGKSLPPGPADAPDPLPPPTCVCGSPWVMGTASEMNADFKDSPRPDATVLSKDAFQDVSDTHPFHLPNIFNECSSDDLSAPCELNLTTVTQPVLKAGELFPEDATVLSAFELKTKFKSRQAIWSEAGLGKGTEDLDQGTNNCKLINEQSYQWALDNAEASVRETFEKYGEPYVMVDDVEAPIGKHGPTWIEEEMIYTRVEDETSGKSHIEVQSWSFVVANKKDGNTQWFIPVGMHYCKLLSPARAMEWIYTEGVRAQLGNH
jgi:hypothetical protein